MLDDDLFEIEDMALRERPEGFSYKDANIALRAYVLTLNPSSLERTPTFFFDVETRAGFRRFFGRLPDGADLFVKKAKIYAALRAGIVRYFRYMLDEELYEDEPAIAEALNDLFFTLDRQYGARRKPSKVPEAEGLQ